MFSSEVGGHLIGGRVIFGACYFWGLFVGSTSHHETKCEAQSINCCTQLNRCLGKFTPRVDRNSRKIYEGVANLG